MNDLDHVSLKNLLLLSKNRDNEAFRWYVEGPEIKPIDPECDTYDTGNTCVQLEYPCLLMFHQLFRFLDDINRTRFKRYSQRDILNLMEHTLESLFQIMNTIDEPLIYKERLSCLLKECDDRHSFHCELSHQGSICSKLGIWLAERFDRMVDSLGASRQYLYLTPMTTITDTDTETDTEDEDEDDDDTGEDDEEEEEGCQEPKKEC